MVAATHRKLPLGARHRGSDVFIGDVDIGMPDRTIGGNQVTRSIEPLLPDPMIDRGASDVLEHILASTGHFDGAGDQPSALAARLALTKDPIHDHHPSELIERFLRKIMLAVVKGISVSESMEQPVSATRETPSWVASVAFDVGV